MTGEEILKLSFQDQVNFWVGKACITIGKGELGSTIADMIQFYCNDAYSRRLAAGLEQAVKKAKKAK